MSHVILLILCALIIGIYAWSAQPGFLELRNPEAKNSFYNLLVQGFSAGQFNLKKDAPPALAQLADPYNPAANAPYVDQLVDLSYYHGKLYLYFGVTPAVVLLWPYAALTGHYLSNKAAVVIFFAVGFLTAAGLLRAIWRHYFPETSVWVLAAGVLTLGVVAGTLQMESLWCEVYEVASNCGFAFTMLALAAVWRSYHEPNRRGLWLLLASLAYGLAVGSRPSLLFGIIVLLLPVVQAWSTPSTTRSRQAGLLLAAAVGPAMLLGLGLMLYNALRFDSPFEFGWRYQLTAYEPEAMHRFNLHFFWFNLWHYFLEPMKWSGHFPYLQATAATSLPTGYFSAERSYGGMLPASYPMIWLALAAPLAWWKRQTEEGRILRSLVTATFLVFVICALTMCLFFAAYSRYEMDFLPALMILATIGILSLERALAGLPVWRRRARWGWGLLMGWTVGFNLLSSIEAIAESNFFAGNSLVHYSRLDEGIEYFNTALILEPGSAAFHAGLGAAYYQEKQLDQAIVEFEKALEIDPNFPEAGQANNDLGYSLLQKGRVNEAIPRFEKALQLNPNVAETHNTLGDCRLQIGQTAEAIVQYQAAVKLKPAFLQAHNNLGFALFMAGRTEEAIVEFQRALEIDPHFGEAEYNLGLSFLRMGKVEEAVVHYQKVIELEPQFIPAKTSLAWVLATWPDTSVRNGGKALALAENANQLTKSADPMVLRTLAAAQAETGQYSEAAATAEQAKALATAQSKTELSEELAKQIQAYQVNSPWRSKNEQ